MTQEPPRYLSKKQAAEYLNVHPNSLDRWHVLGVGPKRIKLGPEGSNGPIRYDRQELDRWMEANSR